MNSRREIVVFKDVDPDDKKRLGERAVLNPGRTERRGGEEKARKHSGFVSNCKS